MGRQLRKRLMPQPRDVLARPGVTAVVDDPVPQPTFRLRRGSSRSPEGLASFRAIRGDGTLDENGDGTGTLVLRLVSSTRT